MGWANTLLVVIDLVSATGGATERYANTLRELFGQFERCIRVSPTSFEAQITVRFALRRDGALLGRPKITFSRLPRDEAARRAAVAALANSLARCLPARITDGLGGAVAGRPLTIRLVIAPARTRV